MPTAGLDWMVSATVLDPEHWFASATSTFLDQATRLHAVDVPEPYRHLLVHDGSMTERLENFFADRVTLQTISQLVSGDRCARWSLLVGRSGRCLALGGICLALDHCREGLRSQIVGGQQPLGRLLSAEGLRYRSVPQAYFRVRPTPQLADLLHMDRPRDVFARRTDLQLAGLTGGAVVELLPYYGAHTERPFGAPCASR